MFYTICSARSGSQMLHVALQQHPDIRVCIEPLNTECAGYDETCRAIIRELYGIEVPASGKLHRPPFATSKYLREIEKHYDVAKLLYHHLNGDIRAHIQASDIIHLIRRNHLAIAVSLAVARRRDVWHIESTQRRSELDLSPVEIDVENTLQFTKRLKAMNRQFEDRFTVYYEDLCDDWSGQIQRVQKMLGLSPVDLKLPFVKSVDRPLPEMIENLAEVQDSELAEYLL